MLVSRWMWSWSSVRYVHANGRGQTLTCKIVLLLSSTVVFSQLLHHRLHHHHITSTLAWTLCPDQIQSWHTGRGQANKMDWQCFFNNHWIEWRNSSQSPNIYNGIWEEGWFFFLFCNLNMQQFCDKTSKQQKIYFSFHPPPQISFWTFLQFFRSLYKK